MGLFVFIVALIFLVWSFALLRYHDLLLGCAIFLVVTSTFSSDFFGIDAIGLTWTLDRFWIVFLVLQFAYNWYLGRIRWRSLQTSDLILGAFVVWLVARTLPFPLGSQLPSQPPTLMHLLNGYLIPIFVYLLIKHSRVTPASIYPAVIVLMMFGVYLSLTAILESAGQWSLVFPKFIGNPKLGIHFGRARGPMLQSVRLGVCLNLCLIVLWTYVPYLKRYSRAAWLTAAALTPLFLGAIFLTKTRSIWMGAGVILMVALFTMLKGKARAISFSTLMIVGLLGAIVVGPSLIAFKREYGEAETLESTKMRGAFAYVSYKMFFDKPIVGYGFNQFQIYNRPYLDDRTTNIRLESIRGYVHHNSFASILVDLGLVGGILYFGLAIAFFRSIMRLYHNKAAPDWARASAFVAIGVVLCHAIQMAFHEVSFSTIENTVLAISLGLMQACSQDFATQHSLGSLWIAWRSRQEGLMRPSMLKPNPVG
jgi:O-antigen ligase